MAHGANLIKKSYRLPKYQVEFIEGLEKKGFFGKEPDVVRALLDVAINHFIETRHVPKRLETLGLLNSKSGADES